MYELCAIPLFLHYTELFEGYEVGGSKGNVVKISSFWCFTINIGDGDGEVYLNGQRVLNNLTCH